MGFKGVTPEKTPEKLCSTPRNEWAAQIGVDGLFKKTKKQREKELEELDYNT